MLPIPDEEVVQKIHQNFRITFLKDALLRPMMDDAVVGTLNSLTYFNNTEIVQRCVRAFVRKWPRVLAVRVGGYMYSR